MPLYEFQCGKCDVIFEELVRMGSIGEGLCCPACGGARVSKRMSTCYGRSSDGHGSTHGVGGSCACGGDCGTCTSCSCH